jgi:uncharacterized peroxidase-related enzyme
MQRISSIEPANATGRGKDLLDEVQAKLGRTPNLTRALATAPAALDAYLQFGAALGKGSLDAKFREQIALTVAQANFCEYCLSAHSANGQSLGLRPEEIRASRQARALDRKRNAGLQFAQTLVLKRGDVSDQALADAKAAGFTEGEITEIVANVALNHFTNFFNLVARTEFDFPNVGVSLPTDGRAY